MSLQQNDIFEETAKEAEEEQKMRIEREIYQSIESMKFVYEQMNTLFELSKKQ